MDTNWNKNDYQKNAEKILCEIKLLKEESNKTRSEIKQYMIDTDEKIIELYNVIQKKSNRYDDIKQPYMFNDNNNIQLSSSIYN